MRRFVRKNMASVGKKQAQTSTYLHRGGWRAFLKLYTKRFRTRKNPTKLITKIEFLMIFTAKTY